MFGAPRILWKEQEMWGVRFIASVGERPQVFDCGVESDLGEHG